MVTDKQSKEEIKQIAETANPPLDYIVHDEPIELNPVQKFFEWGTDNVLPESLKGDSAFAAWIVNVLWIDCPYCLMARAAFISFFIGGACGLLLAVLIATVV